MTMTMTATTTTTATYFSAAECSDAAGSERRPLECSMEPLEQLTDRVARRACWRWFWCCWVFLVSIALFCVIVVVAVVAGACCHVLRCGRMRAAITDGGMNGHKPQARDLSQTDLGTRPCDACCGYNAIQTLSFGARCAIQPLHFLAGALRSRCRFLRCGLVAHRTKPRHDATACIDARGGTC